MKYVIYASGPFEVPVIMHELLEHAGTCRRGFVDGIPRSWTAIAAGFWDGTKASGRSVSMDLHSRGEADARLIRRMLEEQE